jgi:hypothetical protein
MKRNLSKKKTDWPLFIVYSGSIEHTINVLTIIVMDDWFYGNINKKRTLNSSNTKKHVQ